jgi:hypothetical protein
MIHHLSIAARDPKHSADVLAEINGGDIRRVIADEGFPSLRRQPASSDHVLGDG